MKVVLLAGGFGTRISEESCLKPKPMIEIGDYPILLHIMKYYYSFGHNEFIICGGYKSFYIKNYFSTYMLKQSSVSFDTREELQINFIDNNVEKWKVTIIDTGLKTETGGRIKRIKEYLDDDEEFLLTYGDGLSDININELINQHKKSDALVTLSSIQIKGRFGSLDISDNLVNNFAEKTKEDGGWINAGFMVINKKAFDYIDGDETSFEFDVLPKISKLSKLEAYKHNGFWKCMDTLKDKNDLEKILESGEAKWVKY